jgi:hypothetical protein
MEKRTAPQWICDAQRLYERKRRMWVCADIVWWVGWRALGVPGQAIDRYEFESATTVSDLEEAGWRATVVVLGRNTRRELAK